MPQLSLYLSDENLVTLRARAKEEGTSMSRHVSRLIEQDAASRSWPSGFWNLYGAIGDDAFTEPLDAPPSDDAELEALFA